MVSQLRLDKLGQTARMKRLAELRGRYFEENKDIQTSIEATTQRPFEEANTVYLKARRSLSENVIDVN